MKKRVADIVMDTLADLGIEQAFCVVGGGSMFLNHALGISKRIKTIYCHHEQACAMAAEGYAKYKCDRPALVQVTTGPGGTNALTGVMGAYLDSIPMFVVSGQCRYNTSVPETGLPLRTRGVQEFDIVNTVKTMTKYAKLVIDPLTIKREIYKAYDLAMSGRRGPVWLDIPQNVQNAQVEEDDLLPPEPALPIVECSQAEIDNVLALLRVAKRPCLLAGSGIRYSGNHAAFLDFLKRVQIPVVTAAAKPDVLHRSHPLFVGAEGAVGQRAGNFVLQNADVILEFGNSLSFYETGWVQEIFAPKAHIVSVNVDANEHKKPGLHIKTFVHCDLKAFFEKMVQVEIMAPADWMAYVEKVKALFDPFEGAADTADGKVNTYSFWQAFSRRSPDDAIVCLGNSGGPISGWLRNGNKTSGQRTVVNVNCGSMGYDIPAACGAAVAASRPVTLLTGDGSFMMNLQELATICHNGLPVRMIIVSNGGYNSLRRTWGRYFNGFSAGCDAESGISMPSFEKVATAFDIPYRKCASNLQIEDSISWLLDQPGPLILEMEESSDLPKSPCVISRLRDDGTSEPAWLQDMSPFIDRALYDELMIAK